MSTEISKRLQTSTGGFSEITALSQRAINAGMAKLANQHPEITHLKCRSKRGDFLEAEIDQPLVSLKVTGASRDRLEYLAKFSSGKLHFNYEDPVNYDVTGWTIAFNVQIDMVNVEPGSAEDKEVRRAIIQPGDYSLTSLFLTFNRGNIIKPNVDRCDFKGAKFDLDDISTLCGILAKWFIDEGPMADRQKRTVAYGLLTTKPDTVNGEAPSFPPTSLKLQTYEYIAPGEDQSKEGLQEGSNNMLLYLQMTDHKEFPSNPILPYSGNFVSDGMDATMCIQGEIFWDRYLLRNTGSRLLHLFNSATYAWVKSTDTRKLSEPKWEIGIGDSGHGDMTFFEWKRTGPSATWTWGSPRKEEQHKLDHWDHHTSRAKLEVTCTTTNKMEAKPGSNIIKLMGKTDILAVGDCGETGTGPMSAPWSLQYKVHVWLEWHTTVTINAVEDGGLAMSLDLDKDNFTVGAGKVECSKSMFDLFNRDRIIKSSSAMQDQLKANLEKVPLHEIEAKLQVDLNSSARFVVPGKGTFHYKNPTFNDNGDVLIEVGYK